MTLRTEQPDLPRATAAPADPPRPAAMPRRRTAAITGEGPDLVALPEAPPHNPTVVAKTAVPPAVLARARVPAQLLVVPRTARAAARPAAMAAVALALWRARA